jgi:hypothetical protein
MTIYCLIYKPTGEVCEVERDKNGALVCFMTYATMEDAQLAIDEYGAADHSIGELPAGIIAFADPDNRLPYYHPFCQAAESAWFDLYEKSEVLQALSDREIAIASDNFTEGFVVALRNYKKGI